MWPRFTAFVMLAIFCLQVDAHNCCSVQPTTKSLRIQRINPSAAFCSHFLREPVFSRPFTAQASAQSGPVLRQFLKWRKEFALPSVCTMVLCHGSCSQYEDGCPSFTGLSILDQEHLGMLVSQDHGCAPERD
jgi:hypothetical protein